MTIDKTTGRGCAWSIASKTIVQHLLAEGIIDKPIFRKPYKNRYDLLRVAVRQGAVYVVSQKDHALIGEPLWTPVFIDAEVWKQAVSKFQANKSLEKNVEIHLLPEMGKYLQNIPDAELISMVRDFLIAQGVINMPISRHNGKTYYFNENKCYSLDAEAKLFPYTKRLHADMFAVRGETCFNMRVWNKAVSQFKVGATLEECIEIFLKTELACAVPQELTPIDQLMQYIASPVYERDSENTDEATFDYIRITVGLPRYRFNSWETLQNEVKNHQKEIYQRVIQKLEKDRQFKKYGIPVDFLKMSNATLLRNFSIEFIFELKKQRIDPLSDMED